MTDPKRLFDDGADDFGKALLGAGRTLDAEQARERKLAMLGAAGAAATAATAVGTGAAAKGALHFTGAAALKWLLFVGLVAAAGGALYVGLSSPGTPNRPGALTEHGDRGPAIAAVSPSNTVILDTNTEQLKPSPAPGDNEMGGAPALSHSEPGAPQAKLAAPDQPVHKSPPADTDTNTKPSPSASGESLAAEVAALQKAREALAAGRPKKALTELNIYTKRFRGGRLALEAEVLRIEALAQSGERKAAAVLAESFLAAHPSSPYANRVRAIAEPSKAAPIQ